MGIFNIIVGIVAMFTQVGQDGEDDED
jgi:hypothetical protein